MQTPVTIVSLELENVKRVQAVHLEPAATGLTVIGGDNAQGKTSILDAITYALGGERCRPTNLQRDGGMAPAKIDLRLSNGLQVERKGKNATLYVTDPTGAKAGQRLLDSFVEELALNLPEFLRMTGKEKAAVLLRILGIGDQLAVLDKEEKAAYDERTTQGRVADSKAKYAGELPEYHDVPDAPLSAGELVASSQAVMQRNATRAAARANVRALEVRHKSAAADKARATARVVELAKMLEDAVAALEVAKLATAQAADALQVATMAPVDEDESTAAIEAQLAALEETNAKVRANLDKRKAIEDARAADEQAQVLTVEVEAVRAKRAALLDGAAMPLPGLSVEAGELTYNGKAWDCMSGAEQIRAGVAIVRKLKPLCGFVLLDKLEALDVAQLQALGAWLQAEGLQGIATRVSTGKECTIIIEDGLVAGQAVSVASEVQPATAGELEY